MSINTNQDAKKAEGSDKKRITAKTVASVVGAILIIILMSPLIVILMPIGIPLALHKHRTKKKEESVLSEKGKRYTEKYEYTKKTSPINKTIFWNQYTLLKQTLPKGKEDPNQIDENGNLPLILAVKKYKLKFIELLLDNGAKVNKPDHTGRSAIHYASEERDGQYIIKILKKHGTDINVDNPDPTNNQTPLYFAIENSNENLVKALLECGANANALSEKGNLPLHSAIINYTRAYSEKNSQPQIIQLLLNHGAKVNGVTKSGDTPLHYCIKSIPQHPEVTELLLKSGADPNKHDSNGNLPLGIAIANSSVQVIKLLVQHDAYTHLKNTKGLNAYNILEKSMINSPTIKEEIRSILNTARDINAKLSNVSASKSDEGSSPILS